MLDQLAVLIPVVIDPVKVTCIFVELVIAELKIHKLKDQQAGSHSDSQTDDVDGRKDLILADIPPGGGEITLEHFPGFIPIGHHPGKNVASWTLPGSNQRPADYESAALTN